MPTASSTAVQPGARAILIVALCCLVTMLEGIGLQAPGLTVPVLGPLFHMTANAKDWFLSASTFGLIIGAAAGGRLSDLIGRKGVLVVSVVLFAIFSLATAASGSIPMLTAMRFLTGLGFGGALPNVIALAVESVPDDKRRTAVGFLYAGLPTGGGLASLIAALASAPSQWPLVYLVGGAAPLLIAPLLLWILPRSKPEPKVAGVSVGVASALFGEGRAGRTLLLWMAFFAGLLIMYLLLGWLPSLMVARGLTRPQASTVQVAFNWFGALGSVATGLMLDRGRRTLSTALVFAATAAALAYLAGAPAQLSFAILAGGLVGATISGAQTVLYSLAPNCYPARIRGTGVGFAVAIGRLGSAAGPHLAGLLVGAGRSAEQVLMTLVPIIAVSACGAILVSILVARQAQTATAA
ncbi:MAG TPA: MFS transporter [Caulobacteraceae bacterium]|nr:MFS transporter [Caulobacteraceae bacterium]